MLELHIDCNLFGLNVVRFNRAFKLNKHRVTETVFCFRRRDFNPAFAHAVFFNVSTLFAVETNTDLVLKALFYKEWAAWVARKAIW